MRFNSHLAKVTAAWVSIVYVICFVGVALIPSVRPGFMMYAFHTNTVIGIDTLNLTTFISGLVIWNAIAFVAVWLWTALSRAIR